MKKTIFTLIFALATVSLFAQNTASPPATVTGKIGQTTITIKYNQPAVKGRNVWAGDLAPYGKVWRTGADNSTSIELDKDVTIEGKALAAGKYALFTIPGEKEWVIIFNKKIAWGAYSYKQEEDVLRVTVKPMANEMTERVTFAVNSDNVSLAWEKVKVAFKVK